MWIKPDKYDDRTQVAEYYWRNCKGEHGIYLLAVEKAITGLCEINKEFVRKSASQFDKYLSMNIEEVKFDWAISSEKNGITVNRCAVCDKVLFSSESEQCLWCGYNGHAV